MLLSLAMASCGGDKPSNNSAKDPDGTVIVNVNRDDGIEIQGICICIDDNYNLFQVGNGWSYGSSFDELTSGKISIVGQVKSIGNINANENTLQNMTWI